MPLNPHIHKRRRRKPKKSRYLPIGEHRRLIEDRRRRAYEAQVMSRPKFHER